MKRMICLLICLMFVAALATPARAEEMKVHFTADSRFEAGSFVTVDVPKTLQSVMNDPGCMAEEYNACLEKNIHFVWYRDGELFAEGESFYFTSAHGGSIFFCRMLMYSDADLNEVCGYVDSVSFTIPEYIPPQLPEITTESIPDGTVGESYYVKLECTDPDVTFSLFRSSLPEGLYLTQHGEIEGVPIEAGFFYVVIMVTDEFGEENFAEFAFNIVEGQQYFLEIVEVPNKLVYTSGETLDMTGLRVRVYTPDGFFDSKDGEKLEYTKNALVTVGEQKIRIAYMDAMDVFYVTVVAAPETKPTEAPTKAAEPADEPTEEPTTIPVAPDQIPQDTTATEITNSAEESTAPTAEDLPLASDDTLTIGAIEKETKSDQTVLIVSIVSAAAVAISGIGAFTVLKLKGPKGKK
jgi:hypothetical protein